jgi:hypothetical protein
MLGPKQIETSAQSQSHRGLPPSDRGRPMRVPSLSLPKGRRRDPRTVVAPRALNRVTFGLALFATPLFLGRTPHGKLFLGDLSPPWAGNLPAVSCRSQDVGRLNTLVTS